MTSLTNNEIKALKMCLNYEDRESQKDDNMSNAGIEEFATLFNGNRNAAGGLVSSLEKKGLGFIDDEEWDIFWLSEDGINTIFDIIEEEGGV